MSRRPARERSVLLIDLDDEAARSCAVAASPVRVLRASDIPTALRRAQDLRPLAVVLGTRVAREEVTKLEQVAKEIECEVVQASDGHDELEAKLKPLVRRALGSL